MERDRVAAIITNFNMPERADALFEYIADNSEWPCDMVMVDNGSDLVIPGIHSTVKLKKNIQTTGGWLAGLRYAKSLAMLENRKHLAYWFITTSAEFVKESGDPLTSMMEFFLSNGNAVAIHAALTTCSTTAHKRMIARGGEGPRKTFLIDNIASLWRADWFDSVGGFDPALVYSWGLAGEICWKARKEGRGIWIHEGARIKKVAHIGYTMQRMGMSAKERGDLASANVKDILGARYGPDFLRKMNGEFVQSVWE